MAFFKSKKMNVIKIDTDELTQAQIRSIRSMNAMLTHILTTDDESEFFDGSAEFMRICASLIKQSHFNEVIKEADGIPYAEQALEYSIDVLQEHINSSNVVTYDN